MMAEISNLTQPANHWLSECMRHFGEQIEDGIDPSISLSFNGVVFEVRLIECPGVFSRKAVNLVAEGEDN